MGGKQPAVAAADRAADIIEPSRLKFEPVTGAYLDFSAADELIGDEEALKQRDEPDEPDEMAELDEDELDEE